MVVPVGLPKLRVDILNSNGSVQRIRLDNPSFPETSWILDKDKLSVV